MSSVTISTDPGKQLDLNCIDFPWNLQHAIVFLLCSKSRPIRSELSFTGLSYIHLLMDIQAASRISLLNCAAINNRGTCVTVVWCLWLFQKDRMEILGQISNCISLKNLYIDFYKDCSSLNSHQQCRIFSYLLQPCQHLLFLNFLMIAVLCGIKSNLSVVLCCIFLVTKDIGQFLMYLLAICTSFDYSLYLPVVFLYIYLFLSSIKLRILCLPSTILLFIPALAYVFGFSPQFFIYSSY